MSDDFKVLQEAEQFQRLFVKPLVDAVRDEVKSHLEPITTAVKDHSERLVKLEGNQKKAMVGFAVYASVAAVAVGAAWTWVKSKFKFTGG